MPLLRICVLATHFLNVLAAGFEPASFISLKPNKRFTIIQLRTEYIIVDSNHKPIAYQAIALPLS